MGHTAAELGLTADEMRACIDHGYARYPTGYEFRITKLGFTRGELQARTLKRPIREQINPGWFHLGFCDDILREKK